MTNQVNSFNAELTDLETAITVLTAQLNKETKTDTKTNQAKQDFYMSEQNQNAMMIVGNEINRLFAIANDGLSKEDHIKETKKNPSFKKAKKITANIIKNHGKTASLDRKDLKQRYSEYSMFALFKNDFVKTANEIIDDGNYCTANQKVIAKMTKDEVYPYPITKPALKDANWVLEQTIKMLDKNNLEIDSFMVALRQNEEVKKWQQLNTIVQSMGKTKTKNGVSVKSMETKNEKVAINASNI